MRKFIVSKFTVIDNSEEETDTEFIKECIEESLSDNDVKIDGKLEVVEIKDVT